MSSTVNSKQPKINYPDFSDLMEKRIAMIKDRIETDPEFKKLFDIFMLDLKITTVRNRVRNKIIDNHGTWSDETDKMIAEYREAEIKKMGLSKPEVSELTAKPEYAELFKGWEQYL